jgi:Mg/Co/Ni transporter MgtE
LALPCWATWSSALAGVVVPMALKVLRIDPALASSIFVTTCTDIMGFFLFLGSGDLLFAAFIIKNRI